MTDINRRPKRCWKHPSSNHRRQVYLVCSAHQGDMGMSYAFQATSTLSHSACSTTLSSERVPMGAFGFLQVVVSYKRFIPVVWTAMVGMIGISVRRRVPMLLVLNANNRKRRAEVATEWKYSSHYWNQYLLQWDLCWRFWTHPATVEFVMDYSHVRTRDGNGNSLYRMYVRTKEKL